MQTKTGLPLLLGSFFRENKNPVMIHQMCHLVGVDLSLPGKSSLLKM